MSDKELVTIDIDLFRKKVRKISSEIFKNEPKWGYDISIHHALHESIIEN